MRCSRGCCNRTRLGRGELPRKSVVYCDAMKRPEFTTGMRPPVNSHRAEGARTGNKKLTVELRRIDLNRNWKSFHNRWITTNRDWRKESFSDGDSSQGGRGVATAVWGPRSE